MHLSHALELGELCKDDPDSGLHLLVRVLLDSASLAGERAQIEKAIAVF